MLELYVKHFNPMYMELIGMCRHMSKGCSMLLPIIRINGLFTSVLILNFGERLKCAWTLLPPFSLPDHTGTYCYEKDLKLVSKANDWSVDLI